MVSEVITYIGLNCFDLILYQACVLKKLQKKVLIIEDNDKVEQCPFSCMLQLPLGLEAKRDIITYRRIDFAFFLPGIEVLNNYDTVFVSAGLTKPPYQGSTNKEVYVTDLFIQNIEAVKRIMSENLCTRRTLVIRNNVFSYLNLDLLSAEMDGLLDKTETVIIDMNENDQFNALLCQNVQSLKFKLLSGTMKKYLLDELKKLCPEATKREIHNAYKAASRGGGT
jgi:hypothetical protein